MIQTDTAPKIVSVTTAIADGWICQDTNGETWWYETRPVWWEERSLWVQDCEGDKCTEMISHCQQPVFRSDLPHSARIVEIRNGVEVQ